MKLFYQLLGILLLCLVAHHSVQAQGLSCQTATPMCNDITPYPVNFTGTGAGTGPQAPAGPDYDCLLTTPSPTYFTITITQSGTIQFDIENTNVVDIDFILWGPFTDLFAANAACNNLGNGGTGGNVIDCSYDPQAFETVNINNAIAGQVYIMMITNYANVATNVYSTPNVGTGQLGCPCQLDANFSIVPLANGTGTMTSSSTSGAEFKVCPGDTLYFNVGVGADNIADTLSIFSSLTTIGSVFTPSQYEIFGPFYPNSPLRDTMDFIVMITPGATQTGVYNFSLGVQNIGTSDCFDSYPITVVIPGIPSLPPGDTICSGGTYDLVAGSFPPTASGTNSYLWTQISGPAATITNATSATATISPPVLPAGDSMRFQLLYNYGGCVFRDTIKIYGYDIDINMTAAPNPVCAGQPVNLTAVLSDTVGVVTTTTCNPSYTFALIPFAPVAAGGTTVTLGDDAVSTARPIGFTFRFYCNNYTQFYIGSNGFITFSAGAPGGITNQTIPNAAAPNNLIALNWTDLDPSGGGTIRYQTLGVAPNRRLVVTFTGVPTYSTNNFFASDFVTVQAILYEGTNIIEQHITYAADDFDPVFGAGAPITIGIENATGTVASSPGVNGASGVYQNQAVRYTPNITTTTTFSPITYAWTPTATLNNSTIYNPIATPTTPTTYHVTIQNGACVFADSIQVNITGSLPAPTVSCGVSTYTTIQFNWTALALPGGGFYQYSINGGATWVNAGTSLTATLTGLAPGTAVTILVRGNNGLGTPCSPGAQGTIICFTLPCTLSLTNTTQNVVCFGESTGSIDITPANGSLPYTYSWSTGATTQDLTGLPAGTYNITVSDNVGCTATSSITITQPAKGLGLTSTGVNPLCNGSTGCIDIDVAYGTGNYSYNWNNGIGISSDSLCGLVAGTYMVTVTDTIVAGSKYCYAYDTITLTQPTPIAITVNSTTNVNCNGANNGMITISATGGTGAHTYLWSNGRTTTTNTGLVAGVYTVTVNDANSCTSTASVTITQPSAVTASIASSTSVTCNGSATGSATAAGAGGTGAYSFTWSNGRTTAANTGLVAGTYTVTVSDANSCTATTSVTITQPSAVTASIASSTSVTCNGSATGSATAAGAGGIGAYSFTWSNGRTTAANTGLVAGVYTVTVRDANNCTATASVTITQPSAVTASIASSTNLTCNGGTTGSATAAGAGGTGAYSFNWSNGRTTTANTGLAAGTYTVTVSDANACTATVSVTITQPSAVTASIASSTNISCNGGTTGSATAAGAGGTGAYGFSWSNGRTTAANTGLAAGTYTVTVSDANACTSTVSVTITQPSAISITVDNIASTSCNGSNGAVSITVTGGTGAYTYNWSNSATTQDISGLANNSYTVTVTDANACTSTSTSFVPNIPTANISFTTTNLTCNNSGDGCIIANVTGSTGGVSYLWSNGATLDSICGLAAGTYTLTVTDTISSGSGSGGQVNLYAQAFDGAHGWTLNVPTGVNGADNNFWTVSSNEAGRPVGTCGAAGGPNQSLHITSVFNPSGGAAYDAGGLCGLLFCPETNMRAESPAFSTVGQSNLTLKFNYIANGDGLIDNASVVYSSNGGATWQTLTASIKSPICPSTQGRWAAYSATLPASCNNNPNVKVGINWTNNDDGVGTDPSVAIDSVLVYTTNSGTAAQVCAIIVDTTITEPADIVITVDSTNNIDCNSGNNGAAAISVVGGTGAYTYSWSNAGTSSNITGLTANTYTVTVTDANNCMEMETITITEPTALTSMVDSTISPTCNGTTDGGIYITTAGGTISYSFDWSNGETTEDLTAIASGNYSVTITDANGCMTTIDTSINQPGAVSVSISASSNVTCAGAANGSATALGSSGTPGYTFVWSTTATTATITGLSAGIYIVTISDQNGCTDTVSVVVTEPSVVTASIPSNTTVTCGGGNDATATAVGAGGTGAHTFVWSAGGQVTATATGLSAGIYTVTVSDANGCSASSSVTITEPTTVVASIPSNTTVTCNGGADATATASGAGGAGGYTFVWSIGGQNTATATGLSANTTYTVTVSDANGCASTASVTIAQPSVVSVDPIGSFPVSCNGGADGEATVSASGGVGGFTYQWDAATGNQVGTTATGLSAGVIYSVTATDANGCIAITTMAVTEPTALSITPAITHILCNTANNSGSITANVSGGAPPYNSYIWDSNAGNQNTQTATGLTAGTYTVTVTDDNLCIITATFTVNPMVALDSATVPLTVVTGILDCQLNPVGELAINPVSGTGYTYLWSNGATNATANALTAGTYNVTITNASGCSVTQTGTVVAPFVPDVNPFVSVSSSSVTIATGETVDIDGGNDQSGLGVTYVWTASSPDISIGNIANHSTNASSNISGTYTLTITATAGTAPNCTDTGSVMITVQSSFVGVPNAFTPGNNDNINNTFKPEGLNGSEIEVFKVFNRWGQLLYDGSDLQGDGWDGKFMGVEQPSETYLYLLQYKLGNSEPVTLRGEFTLIR